MSRSEAAAVLDPVIELDLVVYQGKRLSFVIPFADGANLAGYTSAGRAVDEADAEIMTWTPTVDTDEAQWSHELDVPADATLGMGRYMADLIEAGGEEHARLRGAFEVRAPVSS